MPSAGFEPATPATKRPQTYVLDLAATEVGLYPFLIYFKCIYHKNEAQAYNIMNS
jgi:hypothetical protein